VAETILTAFNAPYRLGEYEHDSTPSIGITVFTHTDTSDDLLKQADLAMYQAKASGRNAIRLFDPQMQAIVTERRALEDDIRSALRGAVSPAEFIPVAEDSGLIVPLGRWISAPLARSSSRGPGTRSRQTSNSPST